MLGSRSNTTTAIALSTTVINKGSVVNVLHSTLSSPKSIRDVAACPLHPTPTCTAGMEDPSGTSAMNEAPEPGNAVGAAASHTSPTGFGVNAKVPKTEGAA